MIDCDRMRLTDWALNTNLLRREAILVIKAVELERASIAVPAVLLTEHLTLRVLLTKYLTLCVPLTEHLTLCVPPAVCFSLSHLCPFHCFTTPRTVSRRWQAAKDFLQQLA